MDVADLAAASLVTTTGGIPVQLAPITAEEHDALFALFAGVVGAREGYPHAAPLTREGYETTFVRSVTVTVVARVNGDVAGAYYLKPNFVGRAAHIANAGYLVAPRFRRQGVGRALLEDSIARAPLAGFDAIQFNLVFASNPARRLYEELGWRAVGRIPEAVEGEDAIVYHRYVGGTHEHP